MSPPVSVREAVELRRLDRARGLRRIDQRRTRLGLRLAEHRQHRDLRELRIRDVAEHVRVGELLRLDHHVHRLRARQAVLAERVLLHDVEHHQRRDALGVRRQLVHRPPAIRRRNRIDPLGLIVLEVGGRHRAALGVGEREDRLGRLALVEAGRTFRRDQPQRVREIGILEHFAGLGRAAVWQEGRRGTRIRRELARRGVPGIRDHVGDRKAIVSVENRLREQIRERQRAEARAQHLPALDGAGHRDGVDAAARHSRVALGLQQLGRQARRRPAARVEAVELAGLRFVVGRRTGRRQCRCNAARRGPSPHWSRWRRPRRYRRARGSAHPPAPPTADSPRRCRTWWRSSIDRRGRAA